MSIRVTIAGRRWMIRYAPAREMPGALGDCSHPPGRHPTIRIRSNLRSLRKLDAEIHELLHASRPELDEEAVDRTASEIARALWKIGWRCVPPP